MKMKLWQTLTKEHLDNYNELNEKEWNRFCETNEVNFANKCSEVGAELFNEFLNEKKGV